MNWTKVLLFIIISCSICSAQDYFQQDVDYVITASLDDLSHILDGEMTITYTNNAPDELNEVYLHVWANAFKDNNTYYAEDAVRRGSRDFYFADDEDRGGYTAMEIKLDGEIITPELVDGYDDVLKLSLPFSLASSQSLNIQIDFTLKMPALFSRLGHEDGTYHFTHWYPRLAVYDGEGWHPMHYGMGEFYGEYGSYQLALTIPDGYRIDFTGRGTAALPVNGAETMSWVINAENVHDFAWVASNEYFTDYEKVKSIDGRDISLTVLRREGYKEYWSEAIDMLKESLSYYEAEVGPYAYDKIVLVQDVKGGNLNMEYPGLIIVGDRGDAKSLEYYINHELGHQWFYGALGFNEYEEPWLDEGLTTYYEHRYTLNKYGISHYAEMSDNLIIARDGLDPLHAVITANNRCQCHQRADTHIRDMSTVNYGIRSYEMAATYYKYLEKYLGREVFDDAMQSFYTEWKYKHPSTNDLQSHFEKLTAKDLDWFFKELLLTDENIDYAIEDVYVDGAEAKVQLRNKSKYGIPVLLEFSKDGVTTGQKWVEAFTGTQLVSLPSQDIDLISLDSDNLIFDVKRSDNYLKTHGVLKKVEPLKISTANSTDPSSETNIFIAALGSFNTSDGWYLGPTILNSTVPPHGFQWELMPYYAFESKSIVGHGRLAYDHYFKNGSVRGVEYSVGYKSFHFSDFETEVFSEQNLRYQRWEPRVSLAFRHEPMSGIKSGLEIKNIRIYQDRLNFGDVGTPPVKELLFDDIQVIRYKRKKENALTTNALALELEYQAYDDIFDETNTKQYLKLTATVDKKIYFSKDKAFDIRLFGSGFLYNTERESASYNSAIVHGSIPLFAGGYNDYRYDGQFFNRRDQDEKRFFRNQIGLHGAGFKNAIGSAYNLGSSNNYALAINMSSDIPIRLPKILRPLKVFFDGGYYSTKAFGAQPLSNDFLYSAGLSLDFEIIKIHFPLVQSKAITDIYKSEDLGILNRVTFSIDIPRFDYEETVEFIGM